MEQVRSTTDDCTSSSYLATFTAEWMHYRDFYALIHFASNTLRRDGSADVRGFAGG